MMRRLLTHFWARADKKAMNWEKNIIYYPLSSGPHLCFEKFDETEPITFADDMIDSEQSKLQNDTNFQNFPKHEYS